jgi:hypothetical protein
LVYTDSTENESNPANKPAFDGEIADGGYHNIITQTITTSTRTTSTTTRMKLPFLLKVTEE